MVVGEALSVSRAVRAVPMHERMRPDGGMRVFLTVRWPGDRPPGPCDRWLPALAAPPGPNPSEVALRAWLALPEQSAALRAAGELAAATDITVTADPGDPVSAHMPLIRAGVVEQALWVVGEGALQRTRRFDAILFHAPSLAAPLIVGVPDEDDVLATFAEAVMASGQELVADGEEEAAGRSPQCYLGLRRVVALPLVDGGERVGALVAESGQIGRFSARELDPIRELAARAARLLA